MKKIAIVTISLTLASIIVIVLLALSYSRVGVTCEAGNGLPLSLSNPSAVPQSVVDDATKLATKLFGDRQKECDDFVNQLLAIYVEAKDKHFVVIFNSGGWGGYLIEASPGWHSIVSGIQTELASLDYESLSLSYQRTAETLRGRLDELVEMATRYPSKAKDLASRVDFLTTHIPDLKVIIAGESNGTIICDSVMNILKDNPQVYSIQTGPPFWHKSNISLERTLVITNNGIVADSVSHSDVWAIIGCNLKALFGFSELRDDFGTPPHRVRAPGHDYWWQYPEVYSQIMNFLDKYFGGSLL